jgi:hypothetical protein
MEISNMDVDAIFAKVRQQLDDDNAVSHSLRAAIELMIMLVADGGQVLSFALFSHLRGKRQNLARERC